MGGEPSTVRLYGLLLVPWWLCLLTLWWVPGGSRGVTGSLRVQQVGRCTTHRQSSIASTMASAMVRSMVEEYPFPSSFYGRGVAPPSPLRCLVGLGVSTSPRTTPSDACAWSSGYLRRATDGLLGLGASC